MIIIGLFSLVQHILRTLHQKVEETTINQRTPRKEKKKYNNTMSEQQKQ